MSHSDPVADFLTRIRNASSAGLRFADVRWNKFVEHIAEVLKGDVFIEHILVRTNEDGMQEMRVFLKYGPKRAPVIHGVKRVSTPGRRRYVGSQHVPCVMNGLGTSVLSTSQGVMSGKKARENHVGGELLCVVW
jgi:small subunit ribosomal protein S8